MNILKEVKNFIIWCFSPDYNILDDINKKLNIFQTLEFRQQWEYDSIKAKIK